MRVNPSRCLLATFLVAAASLCFAAPAAAQGEATFSVGTLLGDDLDLDFGNLESSFDTAPLFAGRLGWVGYPLGVEGSISYSPSGLSTSGFEDIDVKVLYAEANVLVVLIPGPISPFVTGGVGLHRFDVDGADVDDSRFGYNFGGGVKANLGAITIRGDVRDHVTSFDSNEVLIPEILVLEDSTLHNIEVSVGLGVRF